MQKIDQFPRGTSIKIAHGPYVQITVALSEFDLKIGAHTFSFKKIFG